MQNTKKLALLAILAALAGPIQAQTVLIDDTFAGAANTLLDGTTPTYSVDPTEEWTGASNMTLSGTGSLDIAEITTGTQQSTSYLAIPDIVGTTPPVGSVFTLSFTLNAKPAGSSWIGVGFGDTTTTSTVIYGAGNTSPFWALFNTGGNLAYYDETGSGGNSSELKASNPSTPANVVLTLDVLSASSYSFTGTVNGVTVESGTDTSIGASFDDIAVTDYQASGSISDLELTATGVPEPSTWAMLGVGSLGLLIWQARRRRMAA